MLYSIIIFLYNDDNEYYFVITDETAIEELASSLAVAPQLRQEPTAARVRFLRETFENNEVVQKILHIISDTEDLLSFPEAIIYTIGMNYFLNTLRPFWMTRPL